MDLYHWEQQAFERRDAALAEAARRRLLRLAAQAQQEQLGHREGNVAARLALGLRPRATAALMRLALFARLWLRGTVRRHTPPEEALAVPR